VSALAAPVSSGRPIPIAFATTGAVDAAKAAH
jgi:hypothetical protein